MTISTAMILCAGLGTRLRPLTLETPKPLVEVNGKPLIDRVIDPLIASGVSRFIVNVHWLADQIEAHLAKRASDAEFIVSDERDALLETGGGLAKARPLLGDDPIFVANTDAFWGGESDAPLKEMIDKFDSKSMDILLMLAARERTLGFHGKGDFFMAESGVLIRRGSASTAPYAFTGIRIIKPQIYDDAKVEPFSSNVIWNTYLSEGRVHGHVLDEFWLHVGDSQSLKDADIWAKCH